MLKMLRFHSLQIQSVAVGGLIAWNQIGMQKAPFYYPVIMFILTVLLSL